VKSLVSLHNAVLADAGTFCTTDVRKDQETLVRRAEDEGDSLVTITLPLLGKALEQGLATKQWPAHMVSPKWQHHGGLPAFMRGFLSRVFDAKTGYLLDDPDVECIWAVRQVCYLTNKVERECSPERVANAFGQFVETDAEIANILDLVPQDERMVLTRTFRRLFSGILDAIEPLVAQYDLIPKHGPGAVAEKLRPLQKREFNYWPERLETVFPHWRYQANLPKWKIDYGVPIEQELPVRVIAVPKTQTTPRIIAIEPAAMQYAQQGLKRELYNRIGEDVLSNFLDFTDQSRNQRLAHEGSVFGNLATLDLSEASDRVAFPLVMELFDSWPHIADYINATRSRIADVPGFGTIELNKFASMGSALTFPVEAMVFLAIAYMGVESWARTTIPVNQMIGRISVYGDDIIVPTDSVDHVIRLLHLFGAKVNRTKSFWTGKFRESCGKEFYDGNDVSVVRFRQDFPESRGDAARIAALVDFRNRAFCTGLWKTVRLVDEELDSFINLPLISAIAEQHEPCGFLGRQTVTPFLPRKVRYNSDYQVWEQLVPYLHGISKEYVLDGDAGLLEWFHVALHQRDLVDRYASEERPTSFAIKRRWTEI